MASKTTKPTIVLLPGAWHTPAHYASLLGRLQAQDYPTVCPSLPSLASAAPASQSVATDAVFVRDQVLLPLLDDGKEVLLLMHSYGGFPGGAAAKGLSGRERATEGKRGGVVGLVFLTAFVAAEGESLLQLVGGKLGSWVVVDETTGQLTVSIPATTFYNGVPDAVTAEAIAGLLPQAYSSFLTPSPAPAWPDDVWNRRRAYIICTDDQAIPAVGQRAMVERSGVEWEVEEVATGHSPFLAAPELISGLVAGWADRWGVVGKGA